MGFVIDNQDVLGAGHVAEHLAHIGLVAFGSPLVDAAISVCGMALENAHLQAEVRAQIAEKRLWRLRVFEAELTERRRIERDLHDGLQHQLLVLSLLLARAKAVPLGDATTKAIDHAQAQLRIALKDLRDLVRGVYPTALVDRGLASAIEGIAEKLPIPVDLDLSEQRLHPMVEVAAYFVVSEALANIVQHSNAHHATVRVSLNGDALEVDISDDGIGGTNVAGGGLTGIRDRLNALGGTLRVTSLPGQGTHITASIPCA